jgi:hypothetical protein
MLPLKMDIKMHDETSALTYDAVAQKLKLSSIEVRRTMQIVLSVFHIVIYLYYYYYYYYYYHHHHRISHFSALAGKYSPILGFSNQQD